MVYDDDMMMIYDDDMMMIGVGGCIPPPRDIFSSCARDACAYDAFAPAKGAAFGGVVCVTDGHELRNLLVVSHVGTEVRQRRTERGQSKARNF